jgi:hypothetical protein
MCNICEQKIEDVWTQIAIGQEFRTPDLLIGKYFQISNVEVNRIIIIPQNLSISRKAFERAIHYLRSHNHSIDNPCEIRSNNDSNLAGPLCIESRNINNNVRCINYILPILKTYGVVGIDGGRPNKTWVIK